MTINARGGRTYLVGVNEITLNDIAIKPPDILQQKNALVKIFILLDPVTLKAPTVAGRPYCLGWVSQTFDAEYIYGFVWWGGLQTKSMTSQRNRAAHKMADMRYYGNVMTTTRWRLYVTMEITKKKITK